MLKKIIEARYQKEIRDCSNEELYIALLELVKKLAKEKEEHHGKKKLYYISAEFLIGKLLSNNLINLGIYEEIENLLKESGKSLAELEELEQEPSLGNGGLGRLAACFLDSIATLGLNGDGIGLNYHFGLFRQEFVDNRQKELTNPWITDTSWLNKREVSYEVQYRDFSVKSRLYDIDVVGYQSRTNTLHLFDAETVDETIVGEGIHFDKADIRRNLTLFLYPDDSDQKGQLLRVYQQYFMVSNAAQYILEECTARGSSLHDLYEYAVIQINDTHPSMVIPELIRLLVLKGLDMEEAIEVAARTCAYTNHTILAEALEKWPISFLEEAVPALVPIIKKLDEKVRANYADEKTAIIDHEQRVHMANMDIHFGFSVNGVAALHTDILKQSELKHFYQIYPDKFSNKTNGITFRRWLLSCNHGLTSFLEGLIGNGFKRDAEELRKLLAYQEDTGVKGALEQIKKENKRCLKEYIMETKGIEVDENSIFDIQIKRLHEYKRQQMNALYVIYKYLEIKKGNLPKRPVTVIFGAKAAPAYVIAKDIIHLILCLEKLVNQDKDVSPYLKVVMIENYNVSAAEKLIPACDISEQISLASKEASGTGNMKFMLNGALTLGTEDGANVEIHELVGDENIYIFGESSNQVISHYENMDYKAVEYYIQDPEIKKLVDFIISSELLRLGDTEILLRLHAELIKKDWFMTLLDLKEYIETKEKCCEDYEDRDSWMRKVIVNIANAGFFSADRTIAEYNRDIWKLD